MKKQFFITMLLITTLIISGCTEGGNGTVQNTQTTPTVAPSEVLDNQLGSTISLLMENVELQLPDYIERKAISSSRDYFYNNEQL